MRLSEGTSKLGQKRVYFPNDKDRSRSNFSKRPKDDARKDGQDSRKYGGQSSIANLSAVICKCDDNSDSMTVGTVALAGTSLTMV